jgi:hypothetical protein
MAKAPPGQGWFRIRHALITHPRVVRIAEALQFEDASVDSRRSLPLTIDERINLVIGGLCRIWSVGNTHADRIGRIEFATVDTISSIARIDGFGQAMEAVGWLEIYDGGVLLPNFEQHNKPMNPCEVVGRGERDTTIDTPNGIDNTEIDTNDTVDTVDTGYRCTEEPEPEPEPEPVSSIDSLTNTRQASGNEAFKLSGESPPESKAARTKRINAEVARIWAIWPRKDNKHKGCLAIFKVLDGGYSFDELLRRVRVYAATRPTTRTHPDYTFTPHPSTWFNRRSFEDDEFDKAAVEQARHDRDAPMEW